MAFSLNNFTLHDKMALMRKTMNCRLRSAKKQYYFVNKTLEIYCPIYSQTIVYRIETWNQCQEPLLLYRTNALLPQWKQESPTLSSVHLQVL
jgi:hypothetical protein